jgi:hypothetical protein
MAWWGKPTGTYHLVITEILPTKTLDDHSQLDPNKFVIA